MEEVVGVVALQQDDHGFRWCLFKAVTSRATGLVWFLQSFSPPPCVGEGGVNCPLSPKDKVGYTKND